MVLLRRRSPHPRMHLIQNLRHHQMCHQLVAQLLRRAALPAVRAAQPDLTLASAPEAVLYAACHHCRWVCRHHQVLLAVTSQEKQKKRVLGWLATLGVECPTGMWITARRVRRQLCALALGLRD